ncbi:MAG: PRC-barrel domain-containing protein [Gemmobacter sp.]|uniref:PRC-barrel domain-containing protein n=1 Tax=Gemmobacter sp. TaxID=1898957 RepID=UPI001A4604DC|nr:PRC-barrel domain-containing protein [Gemmobacter sp.]MBL8563309.1 PRC-barrel domain-containing protein [Gemmobacter sp.]
MKKLLTSTAVALTLASAAATGAFAQTAPASPYIDGIENAVRASDFIGKRVYITETDTASLGSGSYANADSGWEDAGEINDVILSLSGDTEAVLVDFGGFLGMGEKTVAVDMSRLVMVPDADSPQDYFIVFQGGKADLEAAPAYTVNGPAVAPATMGEGSTGTAPVQTATPTETAADPAADAPVDFAVMTAEDLVGKRVYGPGNEDVGEVSAVALGTDGKITGAVVDVGGFLGIGEKSVALSADMLRLAPDADGERSVLRVSATEAQLKALPAHEG